MGLPKCCSDWANSVWLVYGARIVGGIFSAAMFPAATAYVADVTTEDERSRGMAWQGTAISLGVVFGPAFGGLLARTDLQLHMGSDRFAIPCLLSPDLCGGVVGFAHSSADHSVANGIPALRFHVRAGEAVHQQVAGAGASTLAASGPGIGGAIRVGDV